MVEDDSGHSLDLVLQLQLIADERGSVHGGRSLGGHVATGRWR